VVIVLLKMKSFYHMYEIVNTRLTYKGFITTTFFGVEGFFKLKWSSIFKS